MSDELRIKGISVAPGVLETIVTLAALGVAGVASVESGGLAGLVHKSGSRGVMVSVVDDASLSACVHVVLDYGPPLHEVASNVQNAVAEALASQTGEPVSSVDVFVDAVVFER